MVGLLALSLWDWSLRKPRTSFHLEHLRCLVCFTHPVRFPAWLAHCLSMKWSFQWWLVHLMPMPNAHRSTSVPQCSRDDPLTVSHAPLPLPLCKAVAPSLIQVWPRWLILAYFFPFYLTWIQISSSGKIMQRRRGDILILPSLLFRKSALNQRGCDHGWGSWLWNKRTN